MMALDCTTRRCSASVAARLRPVPLVLLARCAAMKFAITPPAALVAAVPVSDYVGQCRTVPGWRLPIVLYRLYRMHGAL